MIDSTMAGKHPIQIHPVRPLYRFAATGLGASMWFFVSVIFCYILFIADLRLVDVSREKRWYADCEVTMRRRV